MPARHKLTPIGRQYVQYRRTIKFIILLDYLVLVEDEGRCRRDDAEVLRMERPAEGPTAPGRLHAIEL